MKNITKHPLTIFILIASCTCFGVSLSRQAYQLNAATCEGTPDAVACDSSTDDEAIPQSPMSIEEMKAARPTPRNRLEEIIWEIADIRLAATKRQAAWIEHLLAENKSNAEEKKRRDAEIAELQSMNPDAMNEADNAVWLARMAAWGQEMDQADRDWHRRQRMSKQHDRLNAMDERKIAELEREREALKASK